MSYLSAFLVSVAGAILFGVAAIVLTIFAAWMYRGDPSGQGAYAFSLFYSLPISAAVGFAFGLWMGLS